MAYKCKKIGLETVFHVKKLKIRVKNENEMKIPDEINVGNQSPVFHRTNDESFVFSTLNTQFKITILTDLDSEK